jgi:signal transduction histidine kinase/tetratricopeptide (TPR) repeat protein/ActR/RegA family two-component response regulator
LLLSLATLLFFFTAQAETTSIDQLLKQVETAQGVEKMTALNQLSEASLQAGNRVAAADYAQQAYHLATKENQKAQQALALDNMAFIYQDKHDYTNAMKSFVDALKIRDEAKDQAGIASSKNNIGRVFFLQEDVTSALDNLNKALEIRQQLNDKEGAAVTNKNLGEVYLLKGLVGKAKEHYDRSMNLYIELDQIEQAANLANYLGQIMKEVNDYDGALAYYRMSLDFNRSLEKVTDIAADYNNIALTLFAQQSYDEALENNEMAYDIRMNMDNQTQIAESIKNFGMIYAAMKDQKTATEYLEQAVALLKEIGNEPGIQNIYKDVAMAYQTIGNFEKAYENQVAYAKSRDILFNKEKSTALLELTTKYESEFEAEKQKSKIESLEKDQDYNTKLNSFLVALLGLGGLLLVVAWRSYQRKKKANLLLTAKNEEIERQKSEIDKQNTLLEENLKRVDTLNAKLVTEMAERESIEKSSFARDRFLATMSHEMRTPMNIIIGLTHMLLEENPRESQIEHLRTLQFSANNLVVFINDVLDFSKIEAGKLNLESRDFEPTKIFNEINNRYKLPAEDKGLKFCMSIDRKIPENLTGDPTRLNQIFSNLVSNAVKYTNEGSVNVNVELEEMTNHSAMLKLTIKDTGSGISPDQLNEMFRKFGNEKSDDIFEGYATAGLGLAITKRLVDLQNGKIEVTSTDGKGTTFIVYLPYKVAAATTITNKTHTEVKTVKSYTELANNKILLVEDNAINQLVVAKMLRKLGMEVVTANNGLLALEAYDKEYFDLVLMDIQMPEMDGYRTTAEIRKNADPRKRDVPIIALTASAFLTEKEKAKLFGMNDHVGKPFGPEDLLDKMINCLTANKQSIR